MVNHSDMWLVFSRHLILSFVNSFQFSLLPNYFPKNGQTIKGWSMFIHHNEKAIFLFCVFINSSYAVEYCAVYWLKIIVLIIEWTGLLREDGKVLWAVPRTRYCAVQVTFYININSITRYIQTVVWKLLWCWRRIFAYDYIHVYMCDVVWKKGKVNGLCVYSYIIKHIQRVNNKYNLVQSCK